MLIKVLVENTSTSKDLEAEHGLSLYMEIGDTKLLFDTGASNKFIRNGKKLGVDFPSIDRVIISHGHYDHGGGLKAFMEVNNHGKIYIHNKAFGAYYSKTNNGEYKYVGLDKDLQENDRFIFVGDSLNISNNLKLFSNVSGNRLFPSTNKNLMMELENRFKEDNFSHEQNLIINHKDKNILIAGCAHRGIINIIESAKEIIGKMPDLVIGGFHLYNSSEDRYEDRGKIHLIGDYLKRAGGKYYTGHCTGIKAWQELKEILGDRMDYISTGSEIIVE